MQKLMMNQNSQKSNGSNKCRKEYQNMVNIAIDLFCSCSSVVNGQISYRFICLVLMEN